MLICGVRTELAHDENVGVVRELRTRFRRVRRLVQSFDERGHEIERLLLEKRLIAVVRIVGVETRLREAHRSH